MRRTMILAVLAAVLGQAPAQAQVVIYDNLSGFTGTGISVGATGTAAQGAVTITRMFSDNLTFEPGFAGQSVTQIVFTVGNSSASTINARPRLRFYADDNGGTAPGTVLAGFSFNPITFAANSASSFFFTLAAGQVVIPATNSMWAGMLFDNAGATATAAQMQSLGVEIFSTYAAGSSTDAYTTSPAPASGSYLSNNPTATGQTAVPSGSFGWQFQVVPEPSSLALCGLALAGIPAWLRRRRAA